VRPLISESRFRWAFCQLEVLRRCLPARIRQALEELPESLDGTYERILRAIDKVNWKFARRLFQCVAAASRPLRVEELADFLAFDFNAEPTPAFRADWRPEDPISAVLSTCPNFLSIVKVEDSAFIQFSHFSIKEFLTSNRLADTEDIISRFHVSMNPAHTIMAQACLGILLHLDENVTSDSLKSFPLVEYAAKSWVDHARFDNVSTNTLNGIKRLFDPRRPHLKILVWIYDPEISWWIRSERLSQPRGTCLHYASLSGFPEGPELINFLVTEFSPDLNARGFFDDVTPLHLASRDGHVEVARLLLEHGADVDSRDISKWTPLRHALDKRHVEVARVLIEKGADVGAQGVDEWMPLHWASRHGKAELVQVLLEHGAITDAKDVYGWTPWRRALDEGHVQVAQVLSRHSFVAGSQSMSKSPLLHEASRGGYVKFARALLKDGADPSAQDENKSTPLHLASQCCRAEFPRASGCKQLEVIRVLLEHGADARAQDKNKSTPLHLASRCGHAEVVLMLLEHDADARFQDEDKSEATRVFLKHGVVASAKDMNKSTPLHLASRWGHVKVACALLKYSADASAQDAKSLTPLHWASAAGHRRIALVLLGHGADANARDEKNSTPLHLASRGGHVEIALDLLEHDADISAQDKDKSTPVHLVSQCSCPLALTSTCKHLKVAQVLVEHGADADLLALRRARLAKSPDTLRLLPGPNLK
jgi:ankyrin repeat protein